MTWKDLDLDMNEFVWGKSHIALFVSNYAI